ncbi:MAG: hypothetical protein PWP37_687 [Thermotogota bacterium]|nr:hypothetical protein [Thermotogota bacterium]MDK2864495.1 hypothetical protein [Thermotogota bacterium]HCZ06957.1 hypothetical protein [Thermotogota bacterium]
MIHILTGPFGSGKTEISINLALRLKEVAEDVSLLDLDVITPYFRIRDVADLLGEMGIDVVTVKRELKYMDLPIIPGRLTELFSKDNAHIVVDLGGDDDGARVISSLKSLLDGKRISVYFVVNVFRPFNETVDEICYNIERLSSRSRLKFDAIINNSNLGDLSTEEVVLKGEDVVTRVSEITGIPVKWTVLDEALAKHADISGFKYPVFLIKRFLGTPWEGRR